MIFDWPDKVKTDYVLKHFRMNYHLPEEIEQRFVFVSEGSESGSVVFILSDKDMSDNVIYKDDIPILFPSGESPEIYELKEGKLIFQHDILKSAFYLLSGFQEYKSSKKDHFNRFPYSESIQKRIGITATPVVNYYFQWIAEALNAFAETNNLPLVKRKPLINDDGFGFFLTHDVDKVDYYTFNEMVFRAKQLFGIAPTKLGKTQSFKMLWDAKWNYFFTKKNPAWDFEHLVSIEKKYNIPATYFFLDKDLKHQDAYYQITDSKIHELINWLKESGAEIGLHGVCRSSTDQSVMKAQVDRLASVMGDYPIGTRQHRLIYENPITLHIHQQTGFKYDSSLAFAEHEGFRNSYCWPFRIFDHENNCISDVWEFPLNIMDVTLFHYREYDFKQAMNAMHRVLKEVKKFNGLFTLLWHNGFNDEKKLPDVREFYENLILSVIEMKGKGVSANKLVKQLENNVG
jgi:peptidoglycan/xylan/chitin deacetylase (PgdA/CDA1 family)